MTSGLQTATWQLKKVYIPREAGNINSGHVRSLSSQGVLAASGESRSKSTFVEHYWWHYMTDQTRAVKWSRTFIILRVNRR